MAVGSATTGQPYAPVTFLQSLTVYANGVPTLFYALILLAAGWIVMALNRKGAAAQADDFEDDFDDELDELGLEDEDAEEYLTEGRDLSLDEETTSLETEFDHTADEVNEETEQAEADSKKNRFSKKDDSATE
jgi:hypothetical protein